MGYFLTEEVISRITSKLEQGNKIEAIKICKEETGLGLAESKKVVEKIAKQYGIKTKSQGCYVATCVYGSYDCPEVWTLRRYRDNTLGATWSGRLFIRFYYAVSPIVVKLFGNTLWFKKVWKTKLDKMINKLQSNGVESTPYEDKDWRK